MHMQRSAFEVVEEWRPAIAVAAQSLPVAGNKRAAPALTRANHPVLSESMRFIRANCHRPLRVEDVAAASGCSLRWLYSVFQKHATQSPREFLRQVRFENAGSQPAASRPGPALAKARPERGETMPATAWTGHAAVDAAIRFMTANQGRTIQIRDVTQVSGLTRRGLHKAFRKHTGQTPGAFLRRLRLDFAAQLLARYDLPVGQIARRSGFRSSNSFHVAFQRAFRISPGRFRQRQWRMIAAPAPAERR
jgi:transcriptional regulator GlxA family with amidase domain